MESKGSIGRIIKRLEEKLGPVFEVSSKSAKYKKWDKKKARQDRSRFGCQDEDPRRRKRDGIPPGRNE